MKVSKWAENVTDSSVDWIEVVVLNEKWVDVETEMAEMLICSKKYIIVHITVLDSSFFCYS